MLSALKKLCSPGLGKDDYADMEAKNIPSNWPAHEAVKNLSDHILPALKYSPNKLLISLPVNSKPLDNLEDITPPSEDKIAIYLALTEQQRLDGSCTIIDHAAKQKQRFDSKGLKCKPGDITFKPGDLV